MCVGNLLSAIAAARISMREWAINANFISEDSAQLAAKKVLSTEAAKTAVISLNCMIRMAVQTWFPLFAA